MGMTGALKLRQVVENLESILSIEMLCAAQGLDFRQPLTPGPAVARAHAIVRSRVPHLSQDRIPATDIAAVLDLIRSNAFYPA